MQIENSNPQITSKSMPVGNMVLSDVNSFDNRSNRLNEYLDKKVSEYKESGGEMFIGMPDAWYEPFTICCPNGHVSHRYLKSEERGNVCLACYEPTYLCPPDTIEEDLIKVVIL
jgi:hypothetical protein